MMATWKITFLALILLCCSVTFNGDCLNGSGPIQVKKGSTKGCTSVYIGRRVLYYTNGTSSFRIELVQHGDIHPNPGPVQKSSSTDNLENKDPPAVLTLHSSSKVKLRYNRTELLNLRPSSATFVDVRLWKTLKSLGISSKRPTHRGVKGGCRVLKRSGINQAPLFQSVRNVEDQLGVSHLSDFALWNARSIKNKSHMISDLVVSHRIDILALTETWLTGDARDNRSLADLSMSLPSHQFCHLP